MKYSRGFTLIELLLVVALLAIAVGVSGDIILTLVRSYTKTQQMSEIEQNANFITLKLERELKSGTSVSVPALPNSTSTTLTFTDINGMNVSYSCTSCGVSGSYLSRQYNSGSTLQLTVPTTTSATSGIDVSCGSSNTDCFTLLSTNPYTVRIYLKFSSNVNLGGGANTVTVDNTVVLRGSY